MHFYKNIYYLYAAIFFRKLIFAYAIERLFALERGMTVQLVVYAEIIYAITIILLGVPAGIFADKFGRKHLIILGLVFTVFEFGVLIFAHNFWFFALSALVAGLGGSFKNTTWNAMLYDSLLACGKQADFEKTLGRMRAVGFIAALVSGLLGGFLAQQFGFTFNYWLSTGSAFMALLFTLKLSEPPKHAQHHVEDKASIREIISAAYTFFKSHPDVFRMLVHVALIASVVNYMDEFWQVYLNDIAFPLVLFGVVSAGLTLIQMPGALLASKLLNRFSHQTLIIAASIIVTVGILWAAFAQHATGILGMAAVCFAIALIEPVAAGYLHHRADPAARATIESVENMIHFVFIIALGLVFGYLSTQYSIFTGFWVLGFVAAFGCLVYVVIKRSKNICY
ncbi:MAG: MFS transporter [Defluviitaleaceae bacterium]|nr:MFS transporter [Defluviitaleaceae bacterium]